MFFKSSSKKIFGNRNGPSSTVQLPPNKPDGRPSRLGAQPTKTYSKRYQANDWARVALPEWLLDCQGLWVEVEVEKRARL